MKKRIAVVAAAIAALLLSACAGLLGTYEVNLPLYKLQEAMSRRFPFDHRYLELLDISVSNPRIALQPETNRLLTSMDALIAPPFLKKTWHGTFTISGNLQIDPTRNAVILADPHMDSFTLDGVDPSMTRQIAKIGGLLAEQLLKREPLYTFKPEDFRYAGASLIPTKITTKRNGLVVTFEPLK
ncbi:MAG TPA: DUF1439 domain-containing protein [Burkholderiaceae bacterium]|jgi:hypothetical protein|nr:DUF1439 domain-containing protein [Burkholderiaceae bacterium]